MHGLWQGLLSLDQRFEKLTFLLEPKSMCKLYQGSHMKKSDVVLHSLRIRNWKKRYSTLQTKNIGPRLKPLARFWPFSWSSLYCGSACWQPTINLTPRRSIDMLYWFVQLLSLIVGKCDITAQNQLINHTSFMYIYISLSLECLLHTTKTFRLLKYS